MPAVLATTVTASLSVTATLTSSCTINTSTTGIITNAVLNFGTVTSMESDIYKSMSSAGGNKITVLCSNGTAWTIAMNAGNNVNGSQRRMVGGNSEYIPYNLYSDSSCSTSIDINTSTFSGTGTGTLQSFDIYGRIPAGSTLPSVGSYIDTVTMTITY
ncbi:Csu type fimbrial protein [Klebsiella oxytoca]